MGLIINRASGSLNRTNPTEDAVVCMVFTGAAVSGKIALGEPVQIFSADQAFTDYGITSVNNPVAYRDIRDFYEVAGEGAELNFMLVADSNSLEDICDKDNNIAKKLLDFTQGRCVLLLVNYKAPEEFSKNDKDGFDSTLWSAIGKMNSLAKEYDDDNIPFTAILPGFGFTEENIADIPLRSTLSNDYVGVNLWCKANDGIVSQGMLAGVLAKIQVHENCGAVEKGKISDTAFFPDGTPYITLKNQIQNLANKGLIIPTKRGQKSGYFFFDDPTMTAFSSDYSSISWNRTINKAKRIAADILLEKLNSDVEINPSSGKIESSVCSDWESDVERAIRSQMMKTSSIKKREISGVKCTVNPDSDIINDEIDATLSIVRKGQAKIINVTIKYTATV
jgi:hypothetical protein